MTDPAIVPPDGRFQPIRGFGKLWRERPDVRDRLGWALGVELGFDAKLQEQIAEPGVPKTSFLQMYNGQVAALVVKHVLLVTLTVFGLVVQSRYRRRYAVDE